MKSGLTMRMRYLMASRPTSARALRAWMRSVLGLDVPRRPMLPGSAAPMAYVCHSFFERPGDAVVWANRGGGKTMLGAAVTLMDLIFKPGVQVRVLGGSMEQSRKMHEHMMRLLDRPALAGGGAGDSILASAPTRRRIELINGSKVELLSQSHKSVRGTRVHKLRCDEVDEFEPGVWRAAQMVTRSGRCGDWEVRGSVEALSTMHRPFGLMSRLVPDVLATGAQRDPLDTSQTTRTDHAQATSADLLKSNSPPATRARGAARTLSAGDSDKNLTTRNNLASCAKAHDATANTQLASLPVPGAAPAAADVKVFRWGALDVVERCPAARSCDSCVLFDDCRGAAKHAAGFIPVEDLIGQWHRTDRMTWDAEMMCQRPSVSDLVYPGFDARRHVSDRLPNVLDGRCLAGMDFGVRSPTVWLWAYVVGEGVDAVVHVVDEYVKPGGTLTAHLDAVEARTLVMRHPAPAWVGVDPAGRARNAHSGCSDVGLLERRGYRVQSMGSAIAEGIDLIRRRLDHGTLRVHPRCERLIESMQRYHFDPSRPEHDEPVKDGPDHACDALRYLLINLEHQPAPAVFRSYL